MLKRADKVYDTAKVAHSVLDTYRDLDKAEDAIHAVASISGKIASHSDEAAEAIKVANAEIKAKNKAELIESINKSRGSTVFEGVKGGGETENQVINNIRNKVPNDELTPPTSRGNAPLSNKDGRPIEIHHSEQNPNGPFDEMHPSDHRYGENYQKNHPNYNQPSRIDRTQFRKDKRGYWENEWDNGRWDK